MIHGHSAVIISYTLAKRLFCNFSSSVIIVTTDLPCQDSNVSNNGVLTRNARKLSSNNADNKMPKLANRKITTHFCEEALAGQPIPRPFYDALWQPIFLPFINTTALYIPSYRPATDVFSKQRELVSMRARSRTSG